MAGEHNSIVLFCLWLNWIYRYVGCAIIAIITITVGKMAVRGYGTAWIDLKGPCKSSVVNNYVFKAYQQTWVYLGARRHIPTASRLNMWLDLH